MTEKRKSLETLIEEATRARRYAAVLYGIRQPTILSGMLKSLRPRSAGGSRRAMVRKQVHACVVGDRRGTAGSDDAKCRLLSRSRR
jgi:hypothetical protein